MKTGKERLLEDIVNELKKKALEKYYYGGYIFYPAGEVRKRESYHPKITRGQNPLVVKYDTSTCEKIVFIENVDEYLLVDVINDLKGRSKIEDPFEDYFARGIYEERSRDLDSEIVGSNILAERSIVTKYISNVENLPINIEITEDFDNHMKKYGEWCKREAEYNSPEVLRKKMLSKIAVSTNTSSSNENVPAQEQGKKSDVISDVGK